MVRWRSWWLPCVLALGGCVFELDSDDDDSECDDRCGLNAECDGDGGCVCRPDFVPVCGTGDCLDIDLVCDGVSDCANGADESPQNCVADAEQWWELVDACDDGEDIRWRLWSQTRPWAWPGPDEAFVTPGYGLPGSEPIACARGDLVCLGAEAGQWQWGLGLDGEGDCDGCCFECGDGTVDFGALECPGA